MPRSGLLDENSANYHTRALVSFLILLLSSKKKKIDLCFVESLDEGFLAVNSKSVILF